MHRTSVRPAPLDFLLPSSYSSTSNNGRLKDIGISHLANPAPIYLESSLIDGLRTPPADDMGTAYQQPQHSTYSERQDNTFTAATASGNGFTGAGAYPEQNVLQRTYRTSQGPASSLRNELPPTQPLYHQSTSPGPVTKVSSFVPTEESPSRKTTSNNAILPNLQIPSSINNSGGSLAEFAAQVCMNLPFYGVVLIENRLHACFGSNLQIRYIRQNDFLHPLHRFSDSETRQFLQVDLRNGS